MNCSQCAPTDTKPAIAAYRPNDGAVIYPLCIDHVKPAVIAYLKPLRRAS